MIPVQKNPLKAFDLLFFAIFGQTDVDKLKSDSYQTTRINNQPFWTEALFKMIYGAYMLVSVVVLINLLIAMMTDTYQRIQVTNVTQHDGGRARRRCSPLFEHHLSSVGLDHVYLDLFGGLLAAGQAVQIDKNFLLTHVHSS